MPLARQDTEPRPLPPPEGAREANLIERGREGESWLARAGCGGFVAESRARLSVNGAHEHSFFNRHRHRPSPGSRC